MDTMEYTLKQLGSQIREARLKRSMSQTELARLVDLPQTHISRIESGRVDLQWKTLVQLATALGLTPMLVPAQLTPLITNLLDSRERPEQEESIPLVGNLTETEEEDGP